MHDIDCAVTECFPHKTCFYYFLPFGHQLVATSVDSTCKTARKFEVILLTTLTNSAGLSKATSGFYINNRNDV